MTAGTAIVPYAALLPLTTLLKPLKSVVSRNVGAVRESSATRAAVAPRNASAGIRYFLLRSWEGEVQIFFWSEARLGTISFQETGRSKSGGVTGVVVWPRATVGSTVASSNESAA